MRTIEAWNSRTPRSTPLSESDGHREVASLAKSALDDLARPRRAGRRPGRSDELIAEASGKGVLRALHARYSPSRTRRSSCRSWRRSGGRSRSRRGGGPRRRPDRPVGRAARPRGQRSRTRCGRGRRIASGCAPPPPLLLSSPFRTGGGRFVRYDDGPPAVRWPYEEDSRLRSGGGLPRRAGDGCSTAGCSSGCSAAARPSRCGTRLPPTGTRTAGSATRSSRTAGRPPASRPPWRWRCGSWTWPARGTSGLVRDAVRLAVGHRPGDRRRGVRRALGVGGAARPVVVTDQGHPASLHPDRADRRAAVRARRRLPLARPGPPR